MTDKQAYMSMDRHTGKCTCASDYLSVSRLRTPCFREQTGLPGTELLQTPSHHVPSPGYLWKLPSRGSINKLSKIKNKLKIQGPREVVGSEMDKEGKNDLDDEQSKSDSREGSRLSFPLALYPSLSLPEFFSSL